MPLLLLPLLVVAIFAIHPQPETELFLGSGDRLGAVFGGLIFAGIGVAQAIAFATVRYQRIRFPDTGSYPGALLNSTATAFIDEATFRGAIGGRPTDPVEAKREGES